MNDDGIVCFLRGKMIHYNEELTKCREENNALHAALNTPFCGEEGFNEETGEDWICGEVYGHVGNHTSSEDGDHFEWENTRKKVFVPNPYFLLESIGMVLLDTRKIKKDEAVTLVAHTLRESKLQQLLLELCEIIEEEFGKLDEEPTWIPVNEEVKGDLKNE